MTAILILIRQMGRHIYAYRQFKNSPVVNSKLTLISHRMQKSKVGALIKNIEVFYYKLLSQSVFLSHDFATIPTIYTTSEMVVTLGNIPFSW